MQTSFSNSQIDSAKIADKIRKLFALAEKNGNENEAAAAMQKARELLRAHGLAAHEVCAAESEAGAPCVETTAKTARVWAAHWTSLANAAAALANAGQFKGRALGAVRLVFYGQPADVAAANATFTCLLAACEAAPKQAQVASHAYSAGTIGEKRTWNNSFRLGFGMRILGRAQGLAQDEARQAAATPAQSANNQAWALVVASKQDALALHRAKMGIKISAHRPRVSNGSGFSAGVEAGSRHGLAKVNGLIN